METPFLDQLIEEHKNHIESVEVASYAGMAETRKQLAELEAIKAIIVTHCCMGEAEQLACDCDRQPLRYNEFGICKYCGKKKPSEG